MTAYKNFIVDFPSRCNKILKMAKSRAKMLDSEVTLSLVIASAGFVVPFERLRQTGQLPHPSRDREKYKTQSEKLENLMNCKFVGSILHPNATTTWLSGKLKTIEGDPDQWVELAANKVMSNDKTVSNILKNIRNSLAHGNIYTTGSPISRIIFIGVNKNDTHSEISGYTFISVSPDEFLYFLERWFIFLDNENISQFEVSPKIDSISYG